MYTIGSVDGLVVGLTVGLTVGLAVGFNVGFGVGVGEGVGFMVGVGVATFSAVGDIVNAGVIVGVVVGVGISLTVGDCITEGLLERDTDKIGFTVASPEAGWLFPLGITTIKNNKAKTTESISLFFLPMLPYSHNKGMPAGGKITSTKMMNHSFL